MHQHAARLKQVMVLVWFVGIGSATAQIPANGDFENGLTGWTVSGTGSAAALTGTDFTPNLAAAQWPDQLAVISTGPGNLPGGAGEDIDGSGGANDFDAVTLSAPLVFSGSPRVIRFNWAFPSSEEDQANQFDDLMTVEIDADGDLNTTADRTRLLALSSNKPGGNSPFPDGPENASAAMTISGGPAPPLNTNLRFGVHAVQTFCGSIPGTVQTTNTMAVLFRVADQADSSFDSAGLIDNVSVQGACDATLEQVTTTPNDVLIEVKGGGFSATPIASTRVAVDDDGSVLAFVSTANLTGDNPNGISQVFVLDNGAYERVAELGMTSGGEIHSLSLSGTGRYLAISASPDEGDNAELYRYDRNNNTLDQLTTTTDCENVNPSIDDNGSRIAFESTCDSLTGAGTTPKIVLRNGGAGMLAFQGTGSCPGRNPSVVQTNNARYVAFESECDHTGANADGSLEIFRYDRNADQFLQVTDTTGRINSGARLYGQNDGRIMVFTSDADLVGTNADNSLEAFLYDASGGGSFVQLTDEAGGVAAPAYITADTDVDGQNFVLSRLNPLSGTIQVEYRSLSTIPQLVAEGQDVRVPVVAQDGANVIVAFDSAADFLGTNGDGNVEIWRAVVVP